MKNPPANGGTTLETGVWSLDREDISGEEMATHSRILAGIILWTEEPVGGGAIVPQGLQRVRHN